MTPDLEIRCFHVQVEGCLSTVCFSLTEGHPLISANNPQGEKPHPISLHHPTIPSPCARFGFIPKLASLQIELPVIESFVKLLLCNIFLACTHRKTIKSIVLFPLALVNITNVR